MVMQAFIDDSGTDGTGPVCVLAGFVAPSGRWAEFADDWQCALSQEPSLDYFKMTEAAALRGQFAPRKGWTRRKRDDRVHELVTIICEYATVRISASLRHRTFNKYLRTLDVPGRLLATDHPYMVLLSNLVTHITVYGQDHGVSDVVEYILDEQDGFEDEVHAQWHVIRSAAQRHLPPNYAARIGDLPVFGDDMDFLPLQAADLWAWTKRRSLVKSTGAYLMPRRTRRLLNQIAEIQFHYGPALMAKRRRALESVRKKFVAKNPDDDLVHFAELSKRDQRNARRVGRQRRNIKKIPSGERPS